MIAAWLIFSVLLYVCKPISSSTVLKGLIFCVFLAYVFKACVVLRAFFVRSDVIENYLFIYKINWFKCLMEELWGGLYWWWS